MQATQEAILENNKKTDSILSNSQEAIALIAKNTGKIDIANDMMVELTGYNKDELKEMDCTKIYKFLKLDEIKQGDKKRQKLIRKDGSKFMADVFVGEEIIESKEMLLLFTKDVTHQIKQEQDIVMSLELAEKQKRNFEAEIRQLSKN